MNVKFFKLPVEVDQFDEKRKNIQQQWLNTGFADNDDKWLKLIFKYVFEFYNYSIGTDANYSLKNENEIKKCMQDWLLGREDFSGTLTLNLEPLSQDTGQTGYDDMKFQSQFWGKGEKYFVIECKILNESNKSMDRYVFCQESKKTNGKTVRYNDGGLYRFLINKYAAHREFAGMIGFVQKGGADLILAGLKKKIMDLELRSSSGKRYGQLTDKKLLNKGINCNKNTFQSKHVRLDKETDTIVTPVHIYHILFDFT
ncbi:MAG: hypothetical protein KAW12_22340 [Candidatus Aminicenantes bacterium]|nr:hypothetical protein [Candidatus Aminicenantes bacterium]